MIEEDGHCQWFSELEQSASGLYENALERMSTEQRVLTPSIVVKREVYERLGGFDDRLACGEDWEMWVRIAAHFGIWYEVEPLAVYRMHANSNTGRHVRSGDDMRFTRMAIELYRTYLPRQSAEQWTRHALETYARSGLWTAYTLLKAKDPTGAWNVARESLRFSHSPRTIAQAFRLGLKAVFG